MNNSGIGQLLLIAIIIAGAVFLLYLYFKFFKIPKIKNIVFIDGGVGAGKSFYSVSLAIRLYKRCVRRYYIKRFLLTVFNFGKLKDKYKTLEFPVLYSNLRLRNIKFTPLTKDLFYRNNYRFAYGSVLLIDEFSLVADQMMYKDPSLNERLTLFFKLFRHETKGGYCVINSQSTKDLHYSLKYVLSDYLYIHSRTKVPFISVLKVIEMDYTADDGVNIGSVEGDIEDKTKFLLVFNKYYKYYDSCAYSIFTDMLPIYIKNEYNKKGVNVKNSVLVSFKDYQYLYENLEKMKEIKDNEEKQHL